MGPVHNVLNKVDNWSVSDSFFKRNVATRLANITVAVPAELGAVAQNALLTPVQAAGVILGIGARVVAFISGSATVKKFQEAMPGLTDFLRTVARIVAFSIGTALTATVGVVSPTANFKALCALGIAYNEREEAAKEAEVSRIAQEALIEKRDNQIAEDLQAVEQLPHEEVTDSTLVYAKVASAEVAEQVPAEVNTVVVEEAAANSTTVEEENPYAGLEELFSELEAKIAAEEEKVSQAKKSLLSRITSTAADLKYSLAGVAAVAAGALVYYTQFMADAVSDGAAPTA